MVLPGSKFPNSYCIQDFEILRFWLVSSCLKISLKLLSRKGAFHLVLAGHTYNKLGFKRFRAETNPGRTSCQTFGLSCTFVQSRLRLALFSYQAVVELYMGKGWSCCHVLLQLPKSKHSSTLLWGGRFHITDHFHFTMARQAFGTRPRMNVLNFCFSMLDLRNLCQKFPFFQDLGSRTSRGPKTDIVEKADCYGI